MLEEALLGDGEALLHFFLSPGQQKVQAGAGSLGGSKPELPKILSPAPIRSKEESEASF
jgi:hypothetical protein